jgi:hypothetical protein
MALEYKQYVLFNHRRQGLQPLTGLPELQKPLHLNYKQGLLVGLTVINPLLKSPKS